MSKIGLVMEGGAMRGLFTAGVIDVLMENHIEFDGAIGVSAGAGFGCNYVSKQPHRVYRYVRRFCKDVRFSGLISWLYSGDLYGSKFIYHDIPYELDPFDFDTFRDNPCEFYAVATDLISGRAVYHKFKDGHGNDMLWMQGSASLPIVSKPVHTMDGRVLLDGGLSDSIPIKFFEGRGYKKNLIILTRPLSYRKEPMGKSMALVNFSLRKYPNAIRTVENRYKMYNETISYIRKREKDGDVFVIRPLAEVNIPSVSHNREELKRVYLLGRAAAEREIGNIKAWMSP